MILRSDEARARVTHAPICFESIQEGEIARRARKAWDVVKPWCGRAPRPVGRHGIAGERGGQAGKAVGAQLTRGLYRISQLQSPAAEDHTASAITVIGRD